MKLRMLVLIVLLASSLCAQSPEVSDQSNKILAQLGTLSESLDIKNQIEFELVDMTSELSHLHNEEVNAIIRPHIDKVMELHAKLAKLVRAATKGEKP